MHKLIQTQICKSMTNHIDIKITARTETGNSEPRTQNTIKNLGNTELTYCYRLKLIKD